MISRGSWEPRSRHLCGSTSAGDYTSRLRLAHQCLYAEKRWGRIYGGGITLLSENGEALSRRSRGATDHAGELQWTSTRRSLSTPVSVCPPTERCVGGLLCSHGRCSIACRAPLVSGIVAQTQDAHETASEACCALLWLVFVGVSVAAAEARGRRVVPRAAAGLFLGPSAC
jgi:hypothetical protein